ncbi:MAG: SET domain-containing protein-lysine N-methyltransferase [Burkholderiaceae bacterium]|nr:SET domain-containing protein-lysine N-methyltransferase [Burkholderiaceae bacterium]
MPSRSSTPAASPARKIVVKNSRIHGRGVYAARNLKKGERVIEYKGELITWKECDRRPPSDPDDPFHTFFFSLSDGKHVLDASVGGNDARWINHSCNANCETEEDDDARRVFVVAIRDINAGEELNYDYGLIIDERITPTLKKNYACRCGAKNCRGTMLALKSRPKAKTAAKKAARKDARKAAADAAESAVPATEPTSRSRKAPLKKVARDTTRGLPKKPSRRTAPRQETP